MKRRPARRHKGGAEGAVKAMGVARLLAKGWILVCLFAGAHALRIALEGGDDPAAAIPYVLVCVALFLAMVLLFVVGYGASAGHSGLAALKRLKPAHFVPGFNELTFAIFVCLSFIDQAFVAPANLSGRVIEGLEAAIHFVVPGQRALVAALGSCTLDGGRVFGSAFTWLLAIIFLGSALSRLSLTAGLIRLERARRPEMLGPATNALVLGVAAILGFQFLYVGSAIPFVPCSAYMDIPGALLIGLAPLMLAYLIVAALAWLLASGHQK